jgi:hypothetical protein
VLLPALAGFLGLAVYGLFGRNREERSICCHGREQDRGGRT